MKESKEKQPIEIVKPKASDARGLNELFYITWLATYPNEEAGITVADIEDKFKDAFSQEKLTAVSKSLENIPPNEQVLVAKIAGRIVGVLRVVKNENYNTLQSLYVLPDFQGINIGTKLWEEGKVFLDASKDTFVRVAEYNLNAITFYEKHHFQKTGKKFTDERFRMKSGSIIPEIEMVLKAQ